MDTGSPSLNHRLKTGLSAAFLVLVLGLIAFPLTACAESQTITASGEYTMVEGETPAVAKERALVNAMRAVAEQAVVYVESNSKVNNLTLTNDEVRALTRGVVEVVDKQYDAPKRVSDGLCFRVTITAKVSPDDIPSLYSRIEDRRAADELKRLQLVYDESQREVESLKQWLSRASGDDRKTIEQRIAQNELIFSAAQLFEQGYALLVKREYQSAVEAFSNALNLNSQYAAAYKNRGRAYLGLRQFEQARADADKATALSPGEAEVYFVRGGIYIALRQYRQAIADYNKAIDIYPDYVSAYLNRGRAYTLLTQYEQASVDYKKVIGFTPRDVSGYCSRGDAYAALKQYNMAIADYDKVIASDPQHLSAHMARGNAYTGLKQYTQAIADYETVIALDSKYVNAYLERGNVYIALRQYNLAVAEFDTVNALDPRYAAAYFGKGFALFYLNRREEAVEAYRQFIQYSNDPYWIDKAKGYILSLGGKL